MDQLVRAITAGGMVKAVAVSTRELTERARNIHKTLPVGTAALGRTLAAASMMGNALKAPDASLTLQIKGGGPLGTILAVSDAAGDVRGYVQNPHIDLPLREDGKLDVGAAVGCDGTLTVIKDLRMKEPYVGSVGLLGGEIAEDLAAYFVESEQIPTACALGVLVDRDQSVKAAGGYLIQLLPGAGEDVISKVEGGVLAAAADGTIENFVARMNQRAAEIGMEDTTFLNCTGLPAQGHVTSAYDIALMSRELILRHPDIRRFTTIWMDSLRDGAFTLNNTNKLVRFYEGTTGLKTGSTDAAGYCISATAEREGMELIAVVMGSPTGPQRFESAKVLLSYGFSLYTLIRITPEQVLPAVPVTLGTADYVQPVLGAGDALLLEKSQTADLRQEVRLAETLQAPVEAGQEIGELIVHSQGQETARIPIVAGEAVERLQYGQILVRCLKIAFMVDGFRQVG